MRFVTSALMCLVAGGSSSADAQDDDGILKALRTGARWLMSRQLETGAWPAVDGKGDVSPTARACLALVECGFSDSGRTEGDASPRKGVRYVLSQQRKTGGFGEDATTESARHALGTLVIARLASDTGNPHFDAPLRRCLRFVQTARRSGSDGDATAVDLDRLAWSCEAGVRVGGLPRVWEGDEARPSLTDAVVAMTHSLESLATEQLDAESLAEPTTRRFVAARLDMEASFRGTAGAACMVEALSVEGHFNKDDYLTRYRWIRAVSFTRFLGWEKVVGDVEQSVLSAQRPDGAWNPAPEITTTEIASTSAALMCIAHRRWHVPLPDSVARVQPMTKRPPPP